MGRPLKRFHEFIGNQRSVAYAQRLLTGAKANGEPCPHLLLSAPCGCGKNVFAEAIAAEYGTTLYPFFPGEDTRPLHICTLLAQVNYGDIVFVDEAHSLPTDAQQVLYQALDESKIPAIEGGRLNRSVLHSIAHFTLVMATNRQGELLKPLRTRVHEVQFDRYTLRELTDIAKAIAVKTDIEITAQAARRLGEVAQGTPRAIAMRMQALRLFFPGLPRYTQAEVDILLSHQGIDARGLWPQQRVYLTVLAASPHGTCSLERLAVKIGCDAAYVRQDIEPYLIDLGYVDMASARGRMLTEAGACVAADMRVIPVDTTTSDLQDEEDDV